LYTARNIAGEVGEEGLYCEKGGKDEPFNCVNLQLTAEDISRLEADNGALAYNLPVS
jgi:hypothetical protein